MSLDGDIRDNTRAVKALTQQMATFNKVAAELNKNLAILAKAKEMQIGPKRFRDYLSGSVHAGCSTPLDHEHGMACGPRCECRGSGE
jgi:hypothetical protein